MLHAWQHDLMPSRRDSGRLGSQAAEQAPRCKLPVCRCEPTCSDTSPTEAMGQRRHGSERAYVRISAPCQNQWMQIRDATPEDAPAACIVLKRSIAELCEADHRNDPSILEGNKTHKNFCAWTEQTDNSVLLAVENHDILAVESVTDVGAIGLN